ncbi:BlaI/MecI/CopY family transcriptional regulator [Thalassotalea sediminis]|uniref:BlaI/MecI/CopY family transcriptional regulator n=1 Tax=Thalassotalea sediminis TaxID=1759089 RepID=UPI002572DC59|nr:BlaI/MecI/CopY family transcriptional regulator [Thalassotalea sediminis]
MSEISHAEFEVLDALWQQYPATANQVIERLNQQKPWHDKTVKTLLNRLVKKEAISYEKQQRSYLYTPLLDKETYTQNQSANLIERLFSGRVSPLIAGFAKDNKLNKDDINELKAIIDTWEQTQDEDDNNG